MKKSESKKEKKEIKKKAVPAEKKAAPKLKKEIKKEVKPKKAIKAEAEKKIEVPKAALPEKTHVHVVEERKALPEKKKPPKVTRYHGTGGRKTSGARVWISEGSGKYLINGRPLQNYICGRPLLNKMAMEPFVATNTIGKFDVYADAIGGGVCSQIGAVRQAVSQAIAIAKPEHRPVLRKSGLLTRDPREKERKKFGQKRARKRFQYSKR